MAQLNPEELTLLRGVFLFQGAEALADAAAADPRCQIAVAGRGQIIYAPHQFQHSLGVLLSGRVQVSKGELLVSSLGPGDLFGAAALFNDREDYATTLTARASCRLLFFPQEQVAGLLEAHPGLARNYIRYLSGRIRFLDRKIEGLIAGSAERRLAQYLLERQADGAVVLDCSVTGLAGRLNVSRASLYRALDSLAAAGAIEKNGRTVRILDSAGLVSLPH